MHISTVIGTIVPQHQSNPYIQASISKGRFRSRVRNRNSDPHTFLTDEQVTDILDGIELQVEIWFQLEF